MMYSLSIIITLAVQRKTLFYSDKRDEIILTANLIVIPAKAGIHFQKEAKNQWIPACTCMTGGVTMLFLSYGISMYKSFVSGDKRCSISSLRDHYIACLTCNAKHCLFRTLVA
jgi:hypothetical protein